MAFDESEEGSWADAFGIPDELPPIRLPVLAELAAQARTAPVVGQLLALADWLGEQGVPVDEDGDLAGTGAAEAAAAIGMADGTQFEILWNAAVEQGFAEYTEDGRRAVLGPAVQDLADDDEACDIWEAVYLEVTGTALSAAAESDQDLDCDLDAFRHEAGIALLLFMADEVPVADLSDLVRTVTLAEWDREDGAESWQAWVDAHGDPARELLGQMEGLGAVRLSASGEGEVATLTPLGLMTTRNLLIEEEGVDVPLLPSPEEMTAADLLAMSEGASEEQFDAELASWLSLRTAQTAAQELLAAAAGAFPTARMLAMATVGKLGAPAEPALLAALDQPELRGYAKAALAGLAGREPELDPQDVAWLTTDTLVLDGWCDPDLERDEVAKQLAETIPPGTELDIFEMIARIPHPHATHVLTAIGKLHPDKTLAKAARTAAYKATTRQNSGGG